MIVSLNPQYPQKKFNWENSIKDQSILFVDH